MKTIEKIKEMFCEASDNASNYHDSTEVISIDNVNSILQEIFDDFKNRSCEKCYSFCHCSVVRVLKGGIITSYFYCNSFETKDKL